jgi:hypothetical protein
MEWQTIPGFDAYEINKRGQVRIRDTRYPIVRKGNSYMLSADGKRRRVRVDSLLSMAFPQPEAPEVQNQAEPEQATPHPAVTRLQETLAECERLNLRVKELESEVSALRGLQRNPSSSYLRRKAEGGHPDENHEEWLANNTIQCKRMRARIRRTMCGTRNECEGCKHRFAQLKEQN